MTTEPVVKRGENEKLPVLCPFKKRKLDEAGCQEICIRPLTNEKICTKQFHCKSPYKFCWKCLEMGRDTDANLAEGRMGLCAEHLKSHNVVEKTSTVDLPPQKLFRTPPPALAPFKRPVEPEVGASSKTEKTLPMPLPNRAARRGGAAFHKEPTAEHVERLIRSLPKETAPKVSPKPEAVQEKPLQAPAKTAPVVTSVPKKIMRGLIPVDTVLEVDCSLVAPLKGQPRTHFNKKKMDDLYNSIKKLGQLELVKVVSLPDGTFRLRDGERRWRVCKRLNRELRVIVVEGLSPAEEIEQSAVFNLNREGHTPLEQARVLVFLKGPPLNRSVAYLAEEMGVSTVTIYNYIDLVEKLHPEVQALMDPNIQGGTKHLLRSSIAQYLTPLYPHPKEQIETAQTIMKKKMRLRGAQLLIERVAKGLGITSGRGLKPKDPRDHFRAVRRMLVSLDGSLAKLEELSPETWVRVWNSRPLSDRDELSAKIEDLKGRLSKLEDSIREGKGSRPEK